MKKIVLLILIFIILFCFDLALYKAGKEKGYKDCVNDNYYTITPN